MPSLFSQPTIRSRLDHGDYWNNVFIKPWCRLAPYCVGIFLGFVLHTWNEKKMNKVCKTTCGDVEGKTLRDLSSFHSYFSINYTLTMVKCICYSITVLLFQRANECNINCITIQRLLKTEHSVASVMYGNAECKSKFWPRWKLTPPKGRFSTLKSNDDMFSTLNFDRKGENLSVLNFDPLWGHFIALNNIFIRKGFLKNCIMHAKAPGSSQGHWSASFIQTHDLER